ncbi:MAG TPA: 50S ribosomal protein L6 [Dehalococcoidia bacterium]|nr:50S ribosomal protein L6 [Dehalococcoidia bacterium]
MSRVGRAPITLPPGVEVKIEDGLVAVKGPRGELSRQFDRKLSIRRVDNSLQVERPNDDRIYRSLHGTTRSLVANMVQGVTTGFQKSLEMSGIGYRAQKSGENLVLQVGYSHPVEMTPPNGVSFQVEGTGRVIVVGNDKELVGQVAARIRDVRRVDPYKGKGIRYSGEVVRRKAGKAGKVGGKKK